MTAKARNERHVDGKSRNAHGNVDVPRVARSALGSIRFPILLHRGERNEANAWLATFRDLPGYLGLASTEALAIEMLWESIGDGPIFDVSKARGIEPTSENIRRLIARGQKGATAQQDLRALNTHKDSAVVAVAKANGLSRNSLKPMLRRVERWDVLGGAGSIMSGLPRTHQQVASDAFSDMQTYLEDNPARARLILARNKFPIE